MLVLGVVAQPLLPPDIGTFSHSLVLQLHLNLSLLVQLTNFFRLVNRIFLFAKLRSHQRRCHLASVELFICIKTR